MSVNRIPDDAPASALFPEFETLYDLIAPEVEGLTDEQLNWTSDQWEWAHWSIRRQTSHMASLLFRWLVVRWVDTVYPDGDHGVEDVENLAVSANDRALDVGYHDIDEILGKLREGIDNRPVGACSALRRASFAATRWSRLMTKTASSSTARTRTASRWTPRQAPRAPRSKRPSATCTSRRPPTSTTFSASSERKDCPPSSKSPASATGRSTAGTGASRSACGFRRCLLQWLHHATLV